MRTGGLVSLTTLLAGAQLGAQQAQPDTIPARVVQRFVDAANVRDVGKMMTTVAPEAVFSVLPSGEILATGRDSVRALYDEMFAHLTPGFSVDIARRISDGSFVVDHEVFYKGGRTAPIGQATWVYWVTGGFIRHAWSLEPPPESP